MFICCPRLLYNVVLLSLHPLSNMAKQLPPSSNATITTHFHIKFNAFLLSFLWFFHFNRPRVFCFQEVLKYSASYAPENVRLNCPADQASRWSSASNDQNQFLLLEILDEAEQMGPQGGSGMALLESIGFGKFQKGKRVLCACNYLYYSLSPFIYHVRYISTQSMCAIWRSLKSSPAPPSIPSI